MAAFLLPKRIPDMADTPQKTYSNETVIHRQFRKSNYTVMFNEVLDSESLSWKAKGLHSYIMHLPPDWKLYQKQLASVSKDSTDSTRTGFKELEDAGYIYKFKRRDAETKTFAGWAYTVLESLKDSVTIQSKYVESGIEYELITPLKPKVVGDSRNGNFPFRKSPPILSTISTKFNRSGATRPETDTLGIISPENTTPPENKEILSLLEKLLPIGGFSMRLPGPGQLPTEELKKVVAVVLQLRDGTFYSTRRWDAKWIKNRDLSEPRKYGTLHKVEIILTRALNRFALMKKEGYWPENKKTLPRSFRDFLYNPRTSKSFFLDCIYNDAQPLLDATTESLKKSIDPSVLKDAREFYNNLMNTSQAPWSEFVFYKMIKGLTTWYAEHSAALRTTNIMHGWNPHACTINAFINLIRLYHEDGGVLYNLQAGSGERWERFAGWVFHNMDVDLAKHRKVDVVVAEEELKDSANSRFMKDIANMANKIQLKLEHQGVDTSKMTERLMAEAISERAEIDYKKYGPTFVNRWPESVCKKYEMAIADGIKMAEEDND